MSTTHPRFFDRIGNTQLNVLASLRQHKSWHPNCGWVWDNPSNTAKHLDNLVNRGLVRKDDKGRYTPLSHDEVIVAMGGEENPEDDFEPVIDHTNFYLAVGEDRVIPPAVRINRSSTGDWCHVIYNGRIVDQGHIDDVNSRLVDAFFDIRDDPNVDKVAPHDYYQEEL